MGAGRPCTVCEHPDRAELDRAITGGASLSQLAARFRLPATTIGRHRANHVPTEAMRAAVQAAAVVEADHGVGLAQGAARLRTDALRLLAKAEAAGDLRTALAGVREAARCIELMAKLSGDLDASQTINLTVAPAFVVVQAAILTALDPFPDARRAVVRALEGVG